MGIRRFLHFATAAGDRLAAIEDVDVVLPMMRLDHAPGEGGPTCLGLMDWRGSVVPVFDFIPRAANAEFSPEWLLVVLRVRSSRVAVVAADVHGVIAVPVAQCTEWDVPDSPPIRSANVAGKIIRIVQPEAIHE